MNYNEHLAYMLQTLIILFLFHIKKKDKIKCKRILGKILKINKEKWGYIHGKKENYLKF